MWGAFHASELQYLFDDFTLLDGSIKYIEEMDESQEELADQMRRYWGSFSHYGVPVQPGGNAVITDFAQDHHCEFWDSMDGASIPPPVQHFPTKATLT